MGPAAIIISKDLIEHSIITAIVNEIADTIQGTDFWVADEPLSYFHLGEASDGFLYDFYIEALHNYAEEGLQAITGWLPSDLAVLNAGCGHPESHRTLGMFCAKLAYACESIIDLDGLLCQDPAFDPHLPGRLFTLPYLIDDNPERWGQRHCCDAEFMDAWLQHPLFHMI